MRELVEAINSKDEAAALKLLGDIDPKTTLKDYKDSASGKSLLSLAVLAFGAKSNLATALNARIKKESYHLVRALAQECATTAGRSGVAITECDCADMPRGLDLSDSPRKAVDELGLKWLSSTYPLTNASNKVLTLLFVGEGRFLFSAHFICQLNSLGYGINAIVVDPQYAALADDSTSSDIHHAFDEFNFVLSKLGAHYKVQNKVVGCHSSLKECQTEAQARLSVLRSFGSYLRKVDSILMSISSGDTPKRIEEPKTFIGPDALFKVVKLDTLFADKPSELKTIQDHLRGEMKDFGEEIRLEGVDKRPIQQIQQEENSKRIAFCAESLYRLAVQKPQGSAIYVCLLKASRMGYLAYFRNFSFSEEPKVFREFIYQLGMLALRLGEMDKVHPFLKTAGHGKEGIPEVEFQLSMVPTSKPLKTPKEFAYAIDAISHTEDLDLRIKLGLAVQVVLNPNIKAKSEAGKKTLASNVAEIIFKSKDPNLVLDRLVGEVVDIPVETVDHSGFAGDKKDEKKFKKDTSAKGAENGDQKALNDRLTAAKSALNTSSMEATLAPSPPPEPIVPLADTVAAQQRLLAAEKDKDSGKLKNTGVVAANV